MDAPNVAAHIRMSAGGAAGGELRQLIVNKVMMHGIWHLIKESFELAGKSLQRTSGFWQFQEEKVAITTLLLLSYCLKHADPSEPHAVQDQRVQWDD